MLHPTPRGNSDGGGDSGVTILYRGNSVPPADAAGASVRAGVEGGVDLNRPGESARGVIPPLSAREPSWRGFREICGNDRLGVG